MSEIEPFPGLSVNQITGEPGEKTGEVVSETSKNALENLEGDFNEKLLKLRENYFSGIKDEEFISAISSDYDFLSKLSNHMFSSFKSIFESSLSNSYNEIYFFLYLLSFRFNKDFFSDGNIYSEENFLGIFQEYIEKIKSFDDLDSPEANSYLEHFTRLCGVLNLICILSQNDNLKRDLIFKLTTLVRVEISELLGFLEKKNYSDNNILNSIKYILGLLPLNFSYISYIPFEKNTKKNRLSFIKRYREIFESTLNGYKTCEESDFGNDIITRKGFIDRVSVINLTHIISLLIFKLKDKGVTEADILENKDFKYILNLYIEFLNKIFNENNNIIFENLHQVENLLNKNYIRVYSKQNQEKPDDTENFINGLLDGNIQISDVDDLEVIHHLILFNTFEDSVLLKLLDKFLNIGKSSNINFEVIKLKLFNILLTRLSTINNPEVKNVLIRLSLYIDESKVSSQLIFTYSLLYATIGYCYSFFEDDEESFKLSIENYAKFIQINTQDFNYSRYGINIGRYYYNIGKIKASRYNMTGLLYNPRRIKEKDLQQLGVGYLSEQAVLYGNTVLNNSISSLEHHLETMDNNGILNLANLSENVSKTFNSLFNGIVTVTIYDKHSINHPISDSKYTGYVEFPLVNGYIVKFSYPSTLSEQFKKIFKDKSGFDINNAQINFSDINGDISRILKKVKSYLEHFNQKNSKNIELVNDFEKALTEADGIQVFGQGIHSDVGNIVKTELLIRVRQNNTTELLKNANIRNYIDACISMGRVDLLRKLIFILINSDFVRNGGVVSINLEYLNLVDQETMNILFNNVPIPQNVTIELIEGKWENEEEVIANLKILKRAGFKIAIDDFGTGESSINRLTSLLNNGILDFVKIDGKIVQDLLSGNSIIKETTRFTIAFIVKICKVNNVGVVAEYVSDATIFGILIGLGVQYFQGFYLSKPTNINESKK